ncbi:MAG TPA: LPS assembly lipoprotein LptE [Noviherbaspirillum sp.]
MNRRSFLILAGSSALLAGCGFRLRGSGGQAALPFETVHITGAGASSALGLELRRMIQAGSGTQLVDDPKAAQAVVDILSEGRERGAVTLNTQGRIREYTLFYRVRFRVRDNAGQELMGPTEIVLKRDLSYNESQAIAKEKEEEMLYRNMQSDAVQQILRRIAALRLAR